MTSTDNIVKRIVLSIFLICPLTSWSQANDDPKLLEGWIQSTVYIQSSWHKDEVKTGTGFFINSDGTLMTNYHVIHNKAELSDQIMVGMSSDEKHNINLDYYAQVIGFSEKYDVALLKVTRKLNGKNITADSKFPYIPLSLFNKIAIGTEITALGFPGVGAMGTGSSTITVTNGKIAGFTENDWLKLDIRLAPGNSGGPIVDNNGQLVGISTLLKVDSETSVNMGYGRPLKIILPLLASSMDWKLEAASTMQYVYRNQVIDSTTGKPVANAEVMLLKPDAPLYEYQFVQDSEMVQELVLTDKEGWFEFSKGIKRDTKYSYLIHHPDYAETRKKSVLLGERDSAFIVSAKKNKQTHE